MNTKLYKIFSVALTGLIIFSACDKDEGTVNGDIVGTWSMVGLSGTYTRTVAVPAGQPADTEYAHVASWKDAAAVMGALAPAADQKIITHKDNEAMTGFPQSVSYNTATLAAASIAMTLDIQDASSSGDAATYTLKGTYPTVRLDATVCRTAGTVAPIDDQGLYQVDIDPATGSDKLGNFSIAPDINLGDQVLPPFPDGKYSVNTTGEVDKLTIDFNDRDAHDELYAQVKSTWNEGTGPGTGDRGHTGIYELPVDATTGAFGTTGTPAAEGYIMQTALATWGGYLTWYAFNIIAETSAKVADVKNPLTDIAGPAGTPDGTIDAVDMIAYMHMDNLAVGGQSTALGMPYALLVDSSTDLNGDGVPDPVPNNDSDHDMDISGGAATIAAGGKMTYVFSTGTCFPHNETITFTADFERVE
ncbi:MAG: hypothetical protein NZ838_13130 [Candidatus Marinimicrobia bacterium]|nr:hypothetical protein [Candidatus Neomarinimicrobiota bacterium]